MLPKEKGGSTKGVDENSTPKQIKLRQKNFSAENWRKSVYTLIYLALVMLNVLIVIRQCLSKLVIISY